MKHDENLVVFDVQDNGIAFLTLNRPKAMNALNEALINQFEKAFFKAENDPAIKAIVIRGAGKFFVAGADIKFFVEKIQGKEILDIVSFTRKTSELFLAIENSKKLTIAILDGLSLGGGSELALCCQAMVATDKGSMAFPETAIGIYPGLGGMLRLARKVGPALAKYYVFTGKTISAADALELGIVTHLVLPNELEQTIIKLALEGKSEKAKIHSLPDRFKEMENIFSNHDLQDLIKEKMPDNVLGSLAEKTIILLKGKAPIALKMADNIIDQQIGKTMEAAIKIELAHLEEIFSTQDALEGLSCVGKRKPNFKSK
ncbi:MAG: enoyl-CoA hydratase/isomerase family protein [Deltaproteobacteria bacterium]|uniref:enoyl-CoA hydratase/isomerase family protein n=1 Tax=Desulfobacula sp. TaxID=2593537 RepID=UPI0019CA4D3A|nr:enoyl-CoA hydratase/isomerase family protein [Candidatus Desulfobacula maris]MBL6995864.1 enoyl-CoA hydratase/isomerase family protein [Desulfobacula sp.]